MRVKRGVTNHNRHKKIIKANKGYRGPMRNVFRRAMEGWLKAGQHAYVGRKLKKRQFKNLWVVRLNNAAREHGLKYSTFINLVKKAEIKLNKKVLSELAFNYPEVFKVLLLEVK